MTLCGDQNCLRLADDKPPPDRLKGSQQQITVVHDEINTLLAFPHLDVAVDFDKCWETLFKPLPHHNEWYAEQCFNSCSYDLILLLWLKALPSDTIAELCVNRTVASTAILGGLRSFNFASPAGGKRGTLESLSLLGKRVESFAVASPLQLPSELLQKMVFTSQLEVIEASSQMRQARLLPRNHRIFSGTATAATVIPQPAGIEAELQNEQRAMSEALVWAEVDTQAGCEFTLKPTPFPEYLLAPDSEEGDEKQKKYDDMRHFDESDRILPLPCFVAIPHVIALQDPKTKRTKTVIGFRPGSWRGCRNWKRILEGSALLKPGSRVLLQARYHNQLYAKLCAHYDTIDPSSPPFKLLQAVVRNDDQCVSPQSIPACTQSLGSRFPSLLTRSHTDRQHWNLALSDSQHGVLEKMSHTGSPVSVVWGPPGTGTLPLTHYHYVSTFRLPTVFFFDVVSIPRRVLQFNHHKLWQMLFKLMESCETMGGRQDAFSGSFNFIPAAGCCRRPAIKQLADSGECSEPLGN